MFATGSDSEVVVHGYEEHGPDFVRRMNGIFAFALYDQRRERLLAVRDPFGVKPLYWHSDGTRTAMASEVGALIAAGLVTPELDRVALDHYLACRFVPAPRTLFAGVSKLPAASMLVVERGLGAEGEQLPRGPRRPPGREGPRPGGRAGRALHRRRRAPDDVRRALRGVPVRRRGLGRHRRGHGPAQRAPAHDLHDRLPRPRRRAGRAPLRAARPPPRWAPTTTRRPWPRATSSASWSAACGAWRSPWACPPPAR